MGFPATVTGNLTADLELRYTQAGLAVAGGTVAINERKFNRQTNEWEEGEPTFLRISIWRDLGEHAAGSLTKGTRVIVSGKIEERKYQDREGAERTAWEMTVEDIGPSLKFATAQVMRVQSNQQGQQGGQRQQQPQQGYGQPQGQPNQYGPMGTQQGAPQGPPQQQGYPQAPQYQQPQFQQPSAPQVPAAPQAPAEPWTTGQQPQQQQWNSEVPF